MGIEAWNITCGGVSCYNRRDPRCAAGSCPQHCAQFCPKDCRTPKDSGLKAGLYGLPMSATPSRKGGGA